MLLYVHRNRRLIRGTGAQDVHIDFHTAPELCADDVLLVEFIYLVFTRWELPQATHIFVVVFM